MLRKHCYEYMGWSCRNNGRDQTPRKLMGNGGEEDRNCDGDCNNSDIERVREEWKQI